MPKKHVQTENAPRPIGPYSQGVIAGGLLFLSGQIPVDPVTNEGVGGDAGVEGETGAGHAGGPAGGVEFEGAGEGIDCALVVSFEEVSSAEAGESLGVVGVDGDGTPTVIDGAGVILQVSEGSARLA